MINLDRRSLLKSSLLFGGLAVPAAAARHPSRTLPAFYEDIERRTFRFFWDTVNRANGLVPDRWPTPSSCSIAAVGFALPAYAIGAERGWCTREEARDLTLTTLRFFWNAPQGPQRSGVSGHRGFFYHFLDMKTGVRFRRAELSTVDTTILLLGILFAGQYYDRPDALEREIRQLAQAIYARADWNFFGPGKGKPISMGWLPERGLIPAKWVGYNEGMMVNILALGAPVHRAPEGLWKQCTASYRQFWRGEGPTRRLGFGPLFGHQYSHIFIDFRGIFDAPMREAGFDYFENSRRATYANRAWCAMNPLGWAGYSHCIWGLTACDGPGNFTVKLNGRKRQIHGYSARGPLTEPDGMDDGTIAPTAALGCLPFAPEIVLPCAESLLKVHGARIFRKYGFADSFNPSVTAHNARSTTGSIDPKYGWVAGDYLGIDQGAILVQAANYRSEFIWEHMRLSPGIALGLKRAGFAGGWLG